MRTELPLVSIITPSFNSGDFLEQAILSVINQDYPHIEHIIVDGNSTDHSLEILQRYNSKVSWVSEPDRGQADALNKGFQKAQGQIIGWLNADDTYQPQAVHQAVRYLLKHPSASLVYGSFNFIDETGKVIYTHRPPQFSPEKLLYGNIIPNTTMFFRRHIIEEIGGIKLNLHYVLDWEFVLRIALRYQVHQVPALWGNFRITSDTKSVSKSEYFWPEIIPILQEILSTSNNLKSHSDTVLFWAYWFGAIEFARRNRLDLVKSYLEQAFSYKIPKSDEIDQLASAVIETAVRPWHFAFREHPEAQQTLSRFIECLASSNPEQLLKRYLIWYQNLLAIRNYRDLTQKRSLLVKEMPPIKSLISRPLVKSFLHLILGTPLMSRLRTMSNQQVIRWDSLIRCLLY
jgi:glycosyltransferase involved in cell wall biosynthesis